MFVNHTNHSSANWSQTQWDAAQVYGTIVDVPFPNVSPVCSDEELDLQVEESLKKIEELNPDAVLCQGEFVYTYRLILRLKAQNIKVLAACSVRQTVESVDEDGTTRRASVFAFVKFREY